MICSPIIERDVKDMVDTANLSTADLVEIRLDFLKDFDNLSGLAKIKKPVISTCMPSWEGGRFKGSRARRMEILKHALEFSDYVTIELREKDTLRENLIKEAKSKDVKVIVAYHDFEGTPPFEKIRNIILAERDSGADIAKIAFTPECDEDVIRTLRILEDKTIGIPLIVLSMGGVGKISRILGPLLGSYLTFASVSKGKESASGQIVTDNVKEILNRILAIKY